MCPPGTLGQEVAGKSWGLTWPEMAERLGLRLENFFRPLLALDWRALVSMMMIPRHTRWGRTQHGTQGTGVGHSGRGRSRWAWPKNANFINLCQVGEAGEVWSKAVDSSFNVQVSFVTNYRRGLISSLQPESFVNIWNLRGMLSNAYSKMQAPAAWHKPHDFTIHKDHIEEEEPWYVTTTFCKDDDTLKDPGIWRSRKSYTAKLHSPWSNT